MWFESIMLLIQSGHPLLHADLNIDISQSYESVVETSTNPVGNVYYLLNPSCRWVINCVIDLISDQPILCQRGTLTRQLVSNTSLHCDPHYSRQWVVLAPGPSLRHYSLSYIMLRSRLFSWLECAPPNSILLQVGWRVLVLAYWLSTAVPDDQACPA